VSGKRYGRKVGTKVDYTPDQTVRYQDQNTRRTKSLSLTPARVEENEDSTVYYYRSSRAPSGYWRVTVGEEQELSFDWIPNPGGPESNTAIQNGVATFEALEGNLLKFGIRPAAYSLAYAAVRTSVPVEIPAGKRLRIRADIRADRTVEPAGWSPEFNNTPFFAAGIRVERATNRFTGVRWFPTPESTVRSFLPPLNPTHFNTSAPPLIDNDGIQPPSETRLGGNFSGYGDWAGQTSLVVTGPENVHIFVRVGKDTSRDFDPAFRLAYECDLTVTMENA
jgi:hypothetical protein